MAASSAHSLPFAGAPQTRRETERGNPLNLQSPGIPWRESTVAARSAAIDRVILEMRERLDEPLSLRDMADVAYLSPFHFNRVFRQMTGISPCRFLTTLRIEAAKHLLLSTALRVTDVCFAVGYNSLGTFTTQFTQFVGLSPGRYRRLHRIGELAVPVQSLPRQELQEQDQPESEIEGWISVPDTFPLLLFVGLFPTPVPAGEPVACTLLRDPGLFRLAPVPDGSHYLLAAAVSRDGPQAATRGAEPPVAYVSAGNDELLMQAGRVVRGSTDLHMRPVRLTDPPILIDLPLALASHMATELAPA